jgi:hypothetical protein
MGRTHTTTTTHEADRSGSARRCLRALLLSAMTGLLVACGNGGAQPGWGGGGSASPNSATLMWDAVTDTNLSGYRIYYGTAPGTYLQSPGQGLDAGKFTTFTVTGLSSGTTYYFAATAYDASNIESPYSNEVLKAIP